MENWRDIVGFEGIYKISDLGNVKNINTNRILKPSFRKGYLKVCLYKNGLNKTHYIHRLVALNFLKNPYNKTDVNHINKIITDNRLENLEWNTTYENQYHKNNFNLMNFSKLIKEEINRLVPIF